MSFEKAVEAAARAIANFDPEWGTRGDANPGVYDRCTAQTALEAAAPFIRAEALRDAADGLGGAGVAGVAQAYLRACADEQDPS